VVHALLKTRRVNAAAKRWSKTTFPSSFDRLVQVRFGGTDAHARERPEHSSVSASIRRPNRVMHRRVPSARCSATGGSGLRSLAGRMVLPSVRPAALMGFLPFAVLSRHGWGDISAVPDPRAVRATRPPRLIFVGVTRSVWSQSHGKRKWDDSDLGIDGDRLLGFAPVCGPRLRLSWPRDTILPWALPLAGLWAHDSRIRPGTSPDRITSLRAGASTRDCTIRSWALAIRTRHVGELPPSRAWIVTACLPPTSPALQRFQGADALPLRANNEFARRGSLSEVPHRP